MFINLASGDIIGLKGGHGMSDLKILKIHFDHLSLYNEKGLTIDFAAADRVSDFSEVFELKKPIYTQKLIALAGINATGKTIALKLIDLAMAVVLNHSSLNEADLLGTSYLEDQSRMTVDFYRNGMIYELESIFQRDSTERLTYREEFIRRKPIQSVKTKKDIYSFDETEVWIQRSNLQEEIQAVLQDDDSIAIMAARNNGISLRQSISLTNMNLWATVGKVPQEILHVFDPMLDELVTEVHGSDVSYTVKFKNRNQPYQLHNTYSLGNLISSGTIKGQNLLSMMRDVLHTGGYLLVDELENHMNKMLVQMILDIFKSPRMNPKGACLIFTTHYVEILDLVDRKDDIYITRRSRDEQKLLEIINYKDVVKRNDVKKSEVFLSNYIGGTAPSYENMIALEDALCQKK